ncbi:hypothetical protein Tco_0747131 [Tanacetum coccineum]
MACPLPHTFDEIQALVTKVIDEDIIRQKALMELAVQFENASTTKSDFRKAYEKCYDITHESRVLVVTFFKQESNKDYEMNLALYRKAAKIEKQIESKYVWLSQNTNSFLFTPININSFHHFFSHIQTQFQNLTMSGKKITQPLAPEKPTEAIPQPKQVPHSETHRDDSSSEQHTHQPTYPINQGFLTEKEYQQLLQDEEVLRQTLEKESRGEKEWEEKMKKEQAEYELFMFRIVLFLNSVLYFYFRIVICILIEMK